MQKDGEHIQGLLQVMGTDMRAPVEHVGDWEKESLRSTAADFSTQVAWKEHRARRQHPVPGRASSMVPVLQAGDWVSQKTVVRGQGLAMQFRNLADISCLGKKF